MKLWPVFLLCGFLLAGCDAPQVPIASQVAASTNTEVVSSPKSPATETLIPATATPTARPPTETLPPPLPSETPLPACVTVIYEENAQFEIIGPSGLRVLLDVYDPARLSSPVSAADILLTTHTHWDHYHPDFQAAFPGPQLFVQTGTLEALGVQIQGLASAHNQGDPLQPEGGTNYIYILDMGALRLVHFGDIGQNALTEAQLHALGAVDIAFTQLHNPYSEMNAENAKGLHLMDQVQPRLVIPTHLNLDTSKLAVAQWPGWYLEASTVQICQNDLAEATQVLFLGKAVETLNRYLDLAVWRQP